MKSVKMMMKESARKLAKLQALRKKAPQDRKLNYTIRIEKEVFGIER